jgi:hypothetical protein
LLREVAKNNRHCTAMLQWRVFWSSTNRTFQNQSLEQFHAPSPKNIPYLSAYVGWFWIWIHRLAQRGPPLEMGAGALLHASNQYILGRLPRLHVESVCVTMEPIRLLYTFCMAKPGLINLYPFVRMRQNNGVCVPSTMDRGDPPPSQPHTRTHTGIHIYESI